MPYKERILELFRQLKVSSNPRDYGLDSIMIEEFFASLNSRADNSILAPNALKEYLLKLV